MTNGDRIRAMDNEELALWISWYVNYCTSDKNIIADSLPKVGAGLKEWLDLESNEEVGKDD